MMSAMTALLFNRSASEMEFGSSVLDGPASENSLEV